MNNNTNLHLTNTGVGLRTKHFFDFIRNQGEAEILEIHPENFFGKGYELEILSDLAKTHKISYHGVGMSLGSPEPIDLKHVNNLKHVMEHAEAYSFSEHVSWSRNSHIHFHDLLPVIYSPQASSSISDKIKQLQDLLGMQIAVENPSLYVALKHQNEETDFINQLAEKADCKILLDINNVYVSSYNLNYNPYTYLNNINIKKVAEIHLAGHITENINPQDTSEKILYRNRNHIKVDTHSKPVSNTVWQMYEHLVSHQDFSAFTIIEWDNDLPTHRELLDEAHKAYLIQQKFRPKKIA